MNTTGMPFDDIRGVIKNLPSADANAVEVTRNRNLKLAKPAGALGRLEDANEWLAAWTGKSPQILRPLVGLFAGNHGVLEEGYSNSIGTQTADEVSLISAGGGAINQICASQDLGLKIFDLALAYPVNNIAVDASFDERGCAATIAFGMEAIAGGSDLLCFSGFGAGSDVSTSAICAALTDADPASWICEMSEDVDGACEVKLDTIQRALALNKGNLSDPLEVLRRLGGRESAAIVGAILAARMEHIPVILDGFTAMAAALVVKSLNADAVSHCMIGHLEQSETNIALAKLLDMRPLISLGISQEQGCGGALAMGILKSAALVHAQMQEVD